MRCSSRVTHGGYEEEDGERDLMAGIRGYGSVCVCRGVCMCVDWECGMKHHRGWWWGGEEGGRGGGEAVGVVPGGEKKEDGEEKGREERDGGRMVISEIEKIIIKMNCDHRI